MANQCLPTHSDNQKIGIYGGSFNPAHIGHIHVAVTALKRLNLDAIWILVSPGNPLKSHTNLMSSAIRSTQLASILNHPKIKILTIEDQLKTSYSIDTIKAIMAIAPKLHFIWIMGADNFCELHHWYKWKEFVSLVPFAVVDRPNYGLKSISSPAAHFLAPSRIREENANSLSTSSAPKWVFLHTQLHNISSTQLRSQ